MTGFVCDQPDDLPAAIRDAKLLDPAACRRHVEEHFDPDGMVRGYEEVYRRVAG